MAKKRNKEPAITRTCPDGTLIISREWIGWAVIVDYPKRFAGIDEILDQATKKLNESNLSPEGKQVKVSRDGRAVVTFVDKEVVE